MIILLKSCVNRQLQSISFNSEIFYFAKSYCEKFQFADEHGMKNSEKSEKHDIRLQTPEDSPFIEMHQSDRYQSDNEIPTMKGINTA